MKRALFLATGFFAAMSLAMAADDDFSDGIQVDSVEDGADALIGDGICADAEGNCTLRAAIQEANATAGAQTIELPAGTYQLTLAGNAENDGATGDLDITDSVDIVGEGADVTIIDANGAVLVDRVFHIRDPLAVGVTVNLSDLTVTGGSVLNENGGGILLEAAEGGGGPGTLSVKAESSLVLNLERVVVRGNAAASDTTDPGTGEAVGGAGGGIHSTGQLNLVASEISDNQAGTNGGGLYLGAVTTLLDTTVMGNHGENGGGLFVTGSQISNFRRCAIVNNSAVGGGGISTRTQTAIVMTNCTVDGNTATDVGAGINANGLINLIFSTVTDNGSDSDAPNGGAGLNSFASGNFRLWSSIVAGNTVNSTAETPTVRNCGCTGGSGCTQGIQFLSFGHNIEDVDSCGLRQSSDLLNTDPMLMPLALVAGMTPYRELEPGSPAIDAGHETSDCPAEDQRGFERPQDGNEDDVAGCDIGAVERLGSPIFKDGFED